MFWSLLIINTPLAAIQTSTRVIGGYDSTREGNWGDKCLFPILITLLSKGGDQLCELLGEAKRLLIPHKMLKPSLGLLLGVGWLLIRSLIHLFSLIHFLIGSCVHSLYHSFIHPILTYHSSIHPHPCLGLGKGNKLSNISHDIVGGSGH